MSVTTVRLTPEIEKDLEELADSMSRSKSWIINQALSEFIARQQHEQERWEQTVAAMDSVVKGRVVSGKSAHDWLKSWGCEGESDPPSAGK